MLGLRIPDPQQGTSSWGIRIVERGRGSRERSSKCDPRIVDPPCGLWGHVPELGHRKRSSKCDPRIVNPPFRSADRGCGIMACEGIPHTVLTVLRKLLLVF